MDGTPRFYDRKRGAIPDQGETEALFVGKRFHECPNSSLHGRVPRQLVAWQPFLFGWTSQAKVIVAGPFRSFLTIHSHPCGRL